MSLQIKNKGNKYIFKMSLQDAEKLQREYRFSIDQLKIGGNIPLAELAKHVDEQASNEASCGMFAETARYQLAVAEQEYESWELKALQSVRKKILSENPRISETMIKSHFRKKYSDTITKKRKEILALEHQYKILKLMYDSIKKKGELLPTLRNIVQGNYLQIGDDDSATSKKPKNKNNKKKREIKL